MSLYDEYKQKLTEADVAVDAAKHKMNAFCLRVEKYIHGNFKLYVALATWSKYGVRIETKPLRRFIIPWEVIEAKQWMQFIQEKMK